MTEKTSYEIRPEGSAMLRGVFSDGGIAATQAQAEAARTGTTHVITEVTVVTTRREFGRFDPA